MWVCDHVALIAASSMSFLPIWIRLLLQDDKFGKFEKSSSIVVTSSNPLARTIVSANIDVRSDFESRTDSIVVTTNSIGVTVVRLGELPWN